MGLLDRFRKAEQRGSIEDPRVPISKTDFFRVMGWGELVSASGVTVNIDNALGVPALWAAVNLAEDANHVWAGTKTPSGMTAGSAYYAHIVVVHSAVTYTLDVPIAATP